LNRTLQIRLLKHNTFIIRLLQGSDDSWEKKA
jgi:hypothetical protein